MKWLFLLLAIPLLEIIEFFKVNEVVGTVCTISTIISTAVIGSLLVQKQARNLIISFKNNSTNPIYLLGNGLFILISGILLLTPGFISDIIGFLILIPLIRHKTLRYLSKKFISN